MDGMKTYFVIAVGSDHGDDQAGWIALDLAEPRLPAHVVPHKTRDLMSIADPEFDCERWVILDACRGAGEPGTLHRFEWPDARLAEVTGQSSHGIGIATALEMAGILGRLPERVVILAIEAEVPGPGAGLSEAVRGGIGNLVEALLAEVNKGD